VILGLIIRSAKAVWEGTIKKGKGTISAESGLLKNANYSFSTRFQDKEGSNPEELVGAAHAGCFSMALSLGLTEKGYEPERIETEAQVFLDMEEGNIHISKIELSTKVSVPNIEDNEFQNIANSAKENCPISKALKAVPIYLSAKLI
jgi:osmotically inducible protein OsmC